MAVIDTKSKLKSDDIVEQSKIPKPKNDKRIRGTNRSIQIINNTMMIIRTLA